jgi:hypothetical protein
MVPPLNSAVSVISMFLSDPDTIRSEPLQLLEVADIGRLARVCKTWNESMNAPDIWKKLFKREGVPTVFRPDEKNRNYREEFKVLYPITISKKMIGQFLGKVIGKLPSISEAFFNRLNQPDPFQKEKLIRGNYVLVVTPHLIKRAVDKETPQALYDCGNLIIAKENEQDHSTASDLIIPFSLKNLKVLCSYPLSGKKNEPVFKNDSSVFKQSDICPNKEVKVYLMRKDIINLTRSWRYDNQKKLVEDQGFEVTPLRERALYDAVLILKSGKCQDSGYYPPAYARCSDTVFFDGVPQFTVLGGFFSYNGLSVYSCEGNYTTVDMGVVPGIPAEAIKPPAHDN